MKTWILVASSAEAKILTTDNLRIGELEIVREFSHPESRIKTSDLMSGKPGHYKTDNGMRGAYSKNDPKEVEAEHFAFELAHELKIGWDQNQYKSLLIVAPSHFYGLIKKHFHDHKIVELDHISKDYTKYTLFELHDSLKKHLFAV